MSAFSAQKLARWQTIVAERVTWAESVVQVKHMRQCVLDAEHILESSGIQAGEVGSNAMVGHRLDGWRQQMSEYLRDGQLPERDQECLPPFLQQLTNLRPYLVQCYDRKDFPRTNNEMERRIRGLKTRYRRISGRKNWNSYLLRYGRCVADDEWWEQDATGGNTSSSGSLDSIAPAGIRCVARPRPRRASNSRAFVFATSARWFFLRSRIAGLPLLRREFCPDGKKTTQAGSCQGKRSGLTASRGVVDSFMPR